jgi:beta-exotoxin I transport system permease protein
MSRRTLVLVGHSLRRIRIVLVGLGLLLAAFQFLLTEVAAYLTRQGAFSQLADLIPDFVRTAIGPETLAFTSFTGIVSLGYFHPIVITSLVGLMIAIATEPVGEIEMRFVDLTLARPLQRREAITRTLLVLCLAGILMLTVMVAGTWSGLVCCAPVDVERPTFGLIVSLAFNLATLMVCWAGVALAIGMATRRRSVAGAVAGVLALGAYLLDYLGRAWQPAAAVSTLSPFHYFEPMTLVMGQPGDGWNVVVLISIGLAGLVISYIVMGRRDI